LDLRQWDKAKQLVDAAQQDGDAAGGTVSGPDGSLVTMGQLVGMQAKWLEVQ